MMGVHLKCMNSDKIYPSSLLLKYPRTDACYNRSSVSLVCRKSLQNKAIPWMRPLKPKSCVIASITCKKHRPELCNPVLTPYSSEITSEGS